MIVYLCSLRLLLAAHRTLCINITDANTFHVSSYLDRWYKYHFRNKRVFTLPKKPFRHDYDWEHEPYHPYERNQVISAAVSLPQFHSLNDAAQTMFTYGYVSKADEFNEQLNFKLRELGFHPADNSTGAQIVRMTMQLRYKKWRLLANDRCTPLKCAIRALITARWRKLRLLRSTNLAEFERIAAALKITGFLFPDPFYFATDDLTIARKKEVKDECYQHRLAKLASLKKRMQSSEQEFYKWKNTQLKEILNNLSSILLIDKSDSAEKKREAENMLRHLLDVVTKERQAEVLSGPETYALQWYVNEAEKRREYQLMEAKKAEKQLRRTR